MYALPPARTLAATNAVPINSGCYETSTRSPVNKSNRASMLKRQHEITKHDVVRTPRRQTMFPPFVAAEDRRPVLHVSEYSRHVVRVAVVQ